MPAQRRQRRKDSPSAGGEGGSDDNSVRRHLQEIVGSAAGVLRLLPFAHPPTAEDVKAQLLGDDLETATLSLPEGTLAVVYLGSLVKKRRLWEEVLGPLLTQTLAVNDLPGSQRLATMEAVLRQMLLGWVILFPPGGMPVGLPLRGLQQRSVDEPSTEKEIVGPKEALVEDLETNIGLIRNRLRDPALRVKMHVVGTRSRTRIALLYLDGVASSDLVAQTQRGLPTVQIDFVRTAADVAEVLFGRSLTPFPLYEETERSDRLAAALAMGRIGLIVEGSPFGLVVPVTFMEFQKDAESALPGPIVSVYVRTLRLLGLFISTAAPGLYVAILTANPGVLPLPLALTLSTTRFAVPYPVATEALIMLVVVDVLAEATTQAPGAIGNTLAIVGTLIIGQMMVQAHLASSLLMIIVSGSIMGSFLTLKFHFSYALRIWKYAIVLLSAFSGLIGWFTGFLLLLVHLASLKSAGVPYLSPLGPFRPYDLTHYGPWQPNRGNQHLRPAMWRAQDLVRQPKRGRAH